MVMKDRKKFLIASGIGIAAGAALFAFLKKKRENTRGFEEYEDEMYLDFSLNSAFSYEDAEKHFGQKAARNRKIYNGMLKTYFYQFMGPKPPKRPKREE